MTWEAPSGGTTYSAGTLLDLSSTTFNVDLSEAITATDFGSSDYMIYWDSGSSRAEKTLPANIDLSAFDNSWSEFLSNANYSHFNYSPSAGTHGGTTVADQWTTRPLDTSVTTNISGCTRNGNVITIDAGTYYVRFFGNGYYCRGNQTRLRRTNNTPATLISGSPAVARDSSYSYNCSTSQGAGLISISSNNTTLELQTIAALSKSYGMGRYVGGTDSYSVPTNQITEEMHTRIEFWKIG
jgi:hypothetical protein